MSISLLTTDQDLAQYDAWMHSHEQGTLWQSLEWKQYQEALGREVRIYAQKEDEQIRASALVMIDRTSFGLSTWNIVRGPLFVMKNEECIMNNLLGRMVTDAKKDRCLSMYLSPSRTLPLLHSSLCILHSSQRLEQPEATRIIDLTLSEDEILAQMKPKGRYNIKVAEKHGVRVEESNDIDAFHQLISKTGQRDGFISQSKEKYEKFFNDLPGAFLLLAYEKNEPIAGVLNVKWNAQGIYYYGASSYAHRASMAPYLLQWEAMRKCKQAGCQSYDLLGIAPLDSADNHPWKGITSFKEKFGGDVVIYPPEQEMNLRPMMKKMLEVKRRCFG